MQFTQTIGAIFAALSFAAIAACTSVNSGLSNLGLNVEYEDVFAEASSLEEHVYLTAGLYEATLDAVISQCEGVDPDSYTQVACVKASATSQRLSPAVDALLVTNSVYVKSKGDIEIAIRDHGVASPELLSAAATAAANLSLEYGTIKSDVIAFIEGPGA